LFLDSVYLEEIAMSRWQNDAPTHLAGVSKGISGAQRRWRELAQYADFVKFSLVCQCGSNAFRLRVRLEEENAPASPPVQMSCVGCNKRKLLFDPRRHGYEGKAGEHDYWEPPSKSLEYRCPKCGHKGDPERRRQPVSNLPSQILDDPDWPLDDRHGSVVVLPRSEVRGLRFSWTGFLHVKLDNVTYRVAVGWFKKKRARAILQQLGWPIG
jgi:hypothetical protein